MELVYREAIKLSEEKEPFVIATVVKTKGSTPQKAGAKLLVRKDGSAVGTLGGGCVEGDIWFASMETLRRQQGPEYRDYYLNEEIAARDGLVCGGSMYFFIDPQWKPNDTLKVFQNVVAAYDGERPVALATLIKVNGEKENLGSKAFIFKDGSLNGSLGTEDRDRVASDTGLTLIDYDLNKNVQLADGSEIFVEAYTTPASLVLIGGGHISKAIVPLAKMLGFRIFIVDDRIEFANWDRFPEAEDIVVTDYRNSLDRFLINPNTSIVIATRGHNFDDIALEVAAKSSAGYVGLVGSQRKVVLIYEELLNRGISLERIRDIHAPIGLDIGARSPEEIAVSIMSEIVQVRLNGSGKSMRLPERQLSHLIKKTQQGKG